MTALSDRVLDRLGDVADEPDLTGTRYRLDRLLGRGGLGSVYAVHDEVLGRRVALKVLTATDDAARLLAEARVAARLEHPGIVPLHDAGVLPDGRPYYTMKLVDGVHLDEFARRTPSLPDRLRVFQKLCDAVAFAHSRGVIHRDLKPSNVMVGLFGEVLVMDWGVDVAGTPAYRAPEQRTARPDAIEPTADVYALGVLLGALLPAHAPKPLVAIAARATEAEPPRRYPNAQALNLDVQRYVDGQAVLAYRESPLERAMRFYRSNQPLLILLLVYVVIRFGLYIWSRL